MHPPPGSLGGFFLLPATLPPQTPALPWTSYLPLDVHRSCSRLPISLRTDSVGVRATASCQHLHAFNPGAAAVPAVNADQEQLSSGDYRDWCVNTPAPYPRVGLSQASGPILESPGAHVNVVFAAPVSPSLQSPQLTRSRCSGCGNERTNKCREHPGFQRPLASPLGVRE